MTNNSKKLFVCQRCAENRTTSAKRIRILSTQLNTYNHHGVLTSVWHWENCELCNSYYPGYRYIASVVKK